jgi:hypothetical protein
MCKSTTETNIGFGDHAKCRFVSQSYENILRDAVSRYLKFSSENISITIV